MTGIAKEKPSDFIKGLTEWAIAAGRFFQSPQTGYIHLYYKEAEQKAQTIPLLENVLFAFALLRSRLVEQIQEAKVLLKGLLVFQNQLPGESYGNFPVYLHEYPLCHDPSLALQMLAPFYWILKQFGHVLGTELKQQLEQAARLALERSLRAHESKPFPYSLTVRLAAAQLAYGLLWEDSNDCQAGQKRLDICAESQIEGWHTTRHLADILIGLQMVYPSLLNSPWAPLWKRMEQTWHPRLAVYIGPCLREWQEREEPQVNLYDIFCGYFADQFSRRATLLSSCHLHGILVQPCLNKFDLNSIYCMEGKIKEQAWQMVSHASWAYTVLEKKGPYPLTIDKTHTPFRLVWGDLHRLHSLVCQGGNIEKVEYVKEESSLILWFDLRDDLSEEGNAPKKEIEFFVDFHPDIRFHLNEHIANTFELGQKIQCSFGEQKMSIIFDLIEGEGDFLGHLMRGNRPSQIDQKGEKRFHAYDWIFFLRTIRRKTHCRVRAIVELLHH